MGLNLALRPLKPLGVWHNSWYLSPLENDALLQSDDCQSDSAAGSDDEHSDTLRDDVENDEGLEASSGGEDEGDEDGHGAAGNSGWAMAMAKILGKKTPVSTSSILVKNQELDKIKEKAKQELLEKKKQVSWLWLDPLFNFLIKDFTVEDNTFSTIHHLHNVIVK